FLYHHRRALDARRLTADARRRRSVGTVHRTALGAALAHNASLEAMRQAAVAAVAQSKSAGAIEDPTLSVSVAPRTLRGAMGASGDVQISQALPWWGTLDVRRQMADAQAEAADRDVAALRLRLAPLARGAFADWVYVHRALEVNSTNLTLLDSLRSSALIRYSNAQAPQTDVLQADVAGPAQAAEARLGASVDYGAG